MTAGVLDTVPERPTRRDEAWRYAPHALLDQLTFGEPVGVSEADVPALLGAVAQLDGPLVVVVDGVVDTSLSRLRADDGATLLALADARRGDVAGSSDAGPAAPVDAFDALHAEHGLDGAFIELAAGTTLDAPIHVVDVVVAADAPHNTACTSVVIRLGEGSSATVVETRIGSGTDLRGSSTRTLIALERGATLDHVVIQDLAPSQVHLSAVGVTQGAESTYRSRSFNLGAAYGRLATHVRLDGPGAHADLSGLYSGDGEQTLDQQVTIVHAVPDCTSRQSFHGVLDDRSTGVFNGGIDVLPGADGSDAAQLNANLLLSDRAEANTQPRLEILADEVACTHGATVGQLDETALYYLRSRGIPLDAARRLLISAFADQVVDRVELAEVRDWITARLGHDHG